MITKLVIQNFQSHSDTFLELSPGVNMIIGQSDSGKSAIFRALKWLATNRPLGDAFLSWGEDTLAVTAILDDGMEVSHSPKAYSLLPPGEKQEEQEWSAIGTVVPETVQQALNISELSWQGQVDSPFLLSSSGGDVARMLNDVADLDKIDSTLVNINRMARDNRSQLVSELSHNQSLIVDLSAPQYKDLDVRLKTVIQLREWDRKAEALEEMDRDATGLITSLLEVKTKFDAYDGVERRENIVNSAIDKSHEAAALSTKATVAEEQLQTFTQLISALTNVKDVSDAENEIDLLMDLVGQLAKVESDIEKIIDELADVQLAEGRLKAETETLTKMEKQWHDTFPEKCPLCGK